MLSEQNLFSVMYLYEIFNQIQELGYNSLPPAENKLANELSMKQIKALITVYMSVKRGEPALTLNELAGKLKMRKEAASLLVSSLVRKKLLCRDIDPENRRFIRISCSDKGGHFGDMISGEVMKKLSSLLEKLSDEERTAFVATAAKIRRISISEEGGLK
jgi:DNA-binding MarR family transcriptional regulator